jgi:hypothetical protein
LRSVHDYNTTERRFGSVAEWFEFIAYADKYDMGEAAMIVCGDLWLYLQGSSDLLKGEHIEVVFRAYPERHILRDVITKAALKGVSSQNSKFKKQEEEVGGFAQAMLRQYRASIGSMPSSTENISRSL